MDKISDIEFESVGFKKEFGTQLLKLEHVFLDKPNSENNPFVPSRINFFTIILVTEGKMTHEVDFVAYEMTKGDCLFIAKGQIHKFDPSPTYRGYGLIFTEEYMLHHISASALSKTSFLYTNHINPLFFKDFGDLNNLLGSLEKEFSFELGSVKIDVVASMLTVFLLKAQLYAKRPSTPVNVDYLEFIKFQRLVSDRFMQTRHASHYATFLGTTYKQLNKLCQACANRTVKEFINDYVILEAKRRLATTKLPIKHIAYECGFSEASNFLKYFKKLTDITPAQFREMKH
ncbi:MAG: helix-turn-helix transcriptional regulator [Bacteroidota bacterium]